MRNLKKVLSMTLALVMMLGMMTFAGAAEATKAITSADLTDMKDVANKEEVSLLVDLGIINGIKQADGTYKYAPAEGINRASFAKMIFAVMMSKGNPDVYKGTTTGLSDVKGHWGEGYISYCVSTKIASGDNNKKFNPDMPIQTVTAAKMLLTALGYDAKLAKYENDNLWAINVMKDAQDAGLLEGIDLAANDALSRDAAALMIFNTLNAKTVSPKIDRDQGVAYLNGYDYSTKTKGEQAFSLVKVSGTVTTIAAGGVATIPTLFVDGVNVSVNLSGVAITNVLPASPDMVGSEVAVYVKGTANTATPALKVSAIYSSVLVKNAASVVATNYGYKDKGTFALTALLENADTKVASYETGVTNLNVAVYYNGAAAGVNRAANIARIGEYGVVTEFKNNNGKAGVDTVVITDKIVRTVLAAPVVSKDTKGNDVVTFTTLGLSKVSVDTVKGYEGLAKDDVIEAITIGGVTYIEKATTVDGIISGENTAKGWLVDGTYYQTAVINGATNTGRTGGDFKNTYTLYLDAGKNILKAVKVTDKATTAAYAILEDVTFVVGSGLAGSSYLEGKVVFMDGTSEVVKIASVNDVKPVLNSTYNNDLLSGGVSFTTTATLAGAKAVTNTAVSAATLIANQYYGVSKGAIGQLPTDFFFAINGAATAASAKTLAPVHQFYEFTKNSDGQYLLKNIGLSNDMTLADLKNSTAITNGAVLFDTQSVGNANTVFIFSNTDGDKTTYKVYNGIANVPTTNALGIGMVNTIVKNASGVAVYVFVKGGEITTSSKDFIYIADATYTTSAVDGTTCYIYDAYVNGVKAANGLKLDTASVAVGLYTVTSISAKDIYTVNGATPTTGVTMVTGIKSVGNGTIQFVNAFNTKFAYTYTTDTKAYFIDADDVVTETTVEGLALSASNTFYLTAVGTTSEIATIYVKAVDAVAPTPKLEGATHKAATPVGDFVAGVGTATTGVAGTADQIKVTVTPAAGYKVKSITIGGTALAFTTAAGAAAVYDDYQLPADGTVTVTAAVADAFSGAVTVYTYTITVS